MVNDRCKLARLSINFERSLAWSFSGRAAAFDENVKCAESPPGRASAARCGGGLRSSGQTNPGYLRDCCRSAATPPLKGIFLGVIHLEEWSLNLNSCRGSSMPMEVSG